MRKAFRLSPAAALAAVAALVCACAKEERPPPPSTAGALEEVAEVYRFLAHEKQPPPARLKDLEPYRETLQHSWDKLESGELVLVWRVGYSASAPTVLAYEKDAPSQGGAVLLRNGTVRQMTPAEFKAARAGR